LASFEKRLYRDEGPTKHKVHYAYLFPADVEVLQSMEIANNESVEAQRVSI